MSFSKLAVAALVALAACVGVTYQRAGERVTPRSGQTLLFGRLRFFHDGREFFPWTASLGQPGVATNTERHLWLLRLGRRAVSAELHPDGDGSLSIWLASGDYALLGSTEVATSGTAPYEVIALVRVPAGPVSAYAGELAFTTASREGGYLSRGEFGTASVTLLPTDIARATLEQRLGTLPEAPATSAWCAGEALPGFNDSRLAARAKELLDQGCRSAGGPAADVQDPARIPIYVAGDSMVGELVLGRSAPSDAQRLLDPHGGLGPARDNDVTFQVGSVTLRARRLYTPPRTLHQLYFRNDTLVLVVDGAAHGVPATRAEFMRRYPGAKETRREAAWYEMQAPLTGCVWLIAVFDAGTDRLDSKGYACAG